MAPAIFITPEKETTSILEEIEIFEVFNLRCL